MICQPLITAGVAFANPMSATINFDNDPSLSANKIDDVWPNRLLAHELQPAE